MGLQRPPVAPLALRSSPFVLTLWPCPEKIPNALGLASVSFQVSYGRRVSPVVGGEGGQDLLSPRLKFPQSEWRALRQGVGKGWGLVPGASRPGTRAGLATRGRGQLPGSGEAATPPVAFKRRQRARISRRAAALFQNRQELGGRGRRAASSTDATRGLPPHLVNQVSMATA